MNIEQLINTKSKEEVAFIMYSGCIKCHSFQEDKYGAWKCVLDWEESQCRSYYEILLQTELDKGNYGYKGL